MERLDERGNRRGSVARVSLLHALILDQVRAQADRLLDDVAARGARWRRRCAALELLPDDRHDFHRPADGLAERAPNRVDHAVERLYLLDVNWKAKADLDGVARETLDVAGRVEQ